MSDTILSAAWWKAAAIRGLSTAVVVAIPFFGTVQIFGLNNWLTAVAATLFSFVASLLTSLAGIPEPTGKIVPVWLAILERAVKTFAQAIVAGIGAATLFSQVNWHELLGVALVATVGSLLKNLSGSLPPETIDAGTARAGESSVITAAQVVPAAGLTSAATPTSTVDLSIPAPVVQALPADPTIAHTQPTK